MVGDDADPQGQAIRSLAHRLFVRQTWIENIAQAVAKQIKGEHSIRDGQTWKDRNERV